MTQPRHSTAIYKILLPTDWDALGDHGMSLGSELDRADGYIHFSTKAQLKATLDLHYQGAGTVIIAEILASTLQGRDLRWEPARDGSLFPHLYEALDVSMIEQHWALNPKPGHGYELPDLSDT